MSFVDSFTNSHKEDILDNIDVFEVGDSIDTTEKEVLTYLDWLEMQPQQQMYDYDKRRLRTYDPYTKVSNGSGFSNLGISFDPSVMYVLGITHGGSSSGFMLGETFGAATGPDGLVVGILDFTSTSGSSVGGIKGSLTGGCYALFMAEVGPTSGTAGATQFVVGSTGAGGSLGTTGEIQWIHDINSLYIQGAKDCITKTIDVVLPHVPMGMTVGTGNTAHQIRVYDQDDTQLETTIKSIEEKQERSDLIRGFTSGHSSNYTYTPKPFGQYKYSNSLSLDPNTAVSGSGSEAQEASFYLATQLTQKRNSFNTLVRSLMLPGSEIDTLYKLSEYGIPETFRRLYEQ